MLTEIFLTTVMFLNEKNVHISVCRCLVIFSCHLSLGFLHLSTSVCALVTSVSQTFIEPTTIFTFRFGFGHTRAHIEFSFGVTELFVSVRYTTTQPCSLFVLGLNSHASIQL